MALIKWKPDWLNNLLAAGGFCCCVGCGGYEYGK